MSCSGRERDARLRFLRGTRMTSHSRYSTPSTPACTVIRHTSMITTTLPVPLNVQDEP